LLKGKIRKIIFLFDTLIGRIVLSFLMFLSFYILSARVGIDQTFLILLPPFIALTIFYYLRTDLNNIFSKRSLEFSAIFIILSLVVILLHPPNKINEWYRIIILQGLREELYFRFCMLGILKTCDEWRKLRSVQVTVFLFVNSILFTSLHIQYKAFHELFTVFLVSCIFSFLFIQNGIVAAVITHSLWNFYLNLYTLAFLLVLLLFIELLIKRIQRK